MIELKAGQVLEREHEVIQRVIAAMAALADRFDQAHRAEGELVARARDFLREYADRLHHAKEEQWLFPLLEKRGVPASGCPLAALRHEHEHGRALTSELDAVLAVADGARPDLGRLTSILRSLVKLYVDHMWKEDYLLLPMSAKVLSPADDAALVRGFEDVDASFDADKLRTLERFSAELYSRVTAETQSSEV